MKGSDFLMVQLMRIETLALRARCALAAAREIPDRADALRSAALRHAADLFKENSAWATSFAHLIRARATQDRAEFHHSIEGFERAAMPLHAMAARYRAGETELARKWMEDHAVANPARMIDLLAP